MFKVDITSLNREDFQVKEKNGEYLIVPTHTKHRWDEGELHLRSLVVNENGQVLSRGFNKFRNFGESEDDTREFLWAIENNARMEVFEKLDGTLVIVDQLEPGVLHFRTRGSHDLGDFEEPVMALVEEKYGGLGLLKSDAPFFRANSFLFEYVGPNNKIVVDYDEPDLYFLDYVSKSRAIERWPKAPARSMFATLGGMKLAPSLVMKPQDLLKNPPSGQNSEGVVVKFEDSKRRVRRLKFKTPWYVKLHAMRFNMNEKRAGLLAYLLGVSTIEELPEALEGFGIDYEASKFIEPYVIDYLARKRSVEARVMAMLADIKDNAWGLLPRKEYVNTVREHYPDLFNIAMLVYDRREIEDAVASRYLDMPPAHIAQLLGDRETTINSMLKVPDVE